MLNKAVTLVTRNTIKQAVRNFSRAQLQNWETEQPPAVDSVSEYHLDTKSANSKFYNPHTFDPS